jgi:hypothetical protein
MVSTNHTEQPEASMVSETKHKRTVGAKPAKSRVSFTSRVRQLQLDARRLRRSRRPDLFVIFVAIRRYLRGLLLRSCSL